MTKKHLLLVAGFAFLLSSFSAFANFPTYPGTVTKISDGDTIGFLPKSAPAGSKPLSIRMLSEDTAELHLPVKNGKQASQGYWGDQGRAEMASILHVGDAVRLEDHGHDVYGRVLGRVIKGNLDVNLQMVASGWGSLYIICDGRSPCEKEPNYRNACLDASKNGRGLFDPRKPIPELPFLFRARNQDRPLERFVGNARTGLYYRPLEYSAVPICDRVFFSSEPVARSEGFRPAPKAKHSF